MKMVSVHTRILWECRAYSSVLGQLESDAADDIPVTLDDQTNINKFSRFNNRVEDVVEKLDQVNKQLEDMEEVETEMELMDEDEVIMSVLLLLSCSLREENMSGWIVRNFYLYADTIHAGTSWIQRSFTSQRRKF